VGLPEGHEDLHKPLVLVGGPNPPNEKIKSCKTTISGTHKDPLLAATSC